MAEDLRRLLAEEVIRPQDAQERFQRIYKMALDQSRHMRTGNFVAIDSDDLQRLFELYDRECFDQRLRQALGTMPLTFRLSRRMTRAAGKVTRQVMRSPLRTAVRYEIAVSTTLLFQTFEGETPASDSRPILVNGLRCHDRLEALQRIMEHELIHLSEYLVWSDSNCAAGRFQAIASRRFGHTEYRHQLITPTERARTRFGIRPGGRVTFDFDGRRYSGIVNRITQRATILVEDPSGERYNDGKYYRKFYVPLSLLRPEQPAGPRP